LTGAALDWAVAVAEFGYGADSKTNKYSTDWAQGGPIIEREGMRIQTFMDKWLASIPKPFVQRDGPTPLIAAMRCYVASKLGDDIEIPKELTE
jgi:hypothetical protein